jgi:diguanylate cyclase
LCRLFRLGLQVSLWAGRVVVWFVLIMSVVNICLGFALAVYLDGPAPEAVHAPSPLKKSKVSERATRQAVKYQPRPSGEEAPATAEIPEQWLDVLKAENIVAGSFVEASVQVLRLEVGRYRDKLIDVDRRVRECSTAPTVEAIRELLEELRTVNEDWMEQQSEATSQLSGNSDELGDLEEKGSQLETVLMEQAAQIETTCNNIDLLDFDSDMEVGCRRFITEIRKLIDLAHNLRSQMHESLLAIMVAEKKLDSIDRKLQFESRTGVHNRTGLEVLFHELWRDDPNRTRQVSCSMIDIDRFTNLLETYGATITDELLAAFTSLLSELIRSERGFDVICHFDGQRFFAFFGDTGPRNATSAIERIRQTIKESSFVIKGEEVPVMVTCGVTEVLDTDSTTTIYDRLHKAVREGKKAGRDQTVLDEGSGPEKVDPPEYEVKGQVIRI